MALKHKIAVLIPSTTNVCEEASSEDVAKWIRAAKVKLADRALHFVPPLTATVAA